ncbi:MAG: hypothetical protein E7179_03150 [Erysipelotrichaceae bacterium]|jgi:arabinogalactan endo-1,4-beta-galactosidase|nr:hypothetical protein [Erysipelotrichaceae bacterium]
MKKNRLLFLATAAMLLFSCGGGSQASSTSDTSLVPHGSSDSTSTPAASSTGGTSSDSSTTQPSSSSSTTVVPEESSTSYDPGLHNDEVYDYDALKVNAPSKALGDDFAYGADLSAVAAVEKAGGVYFNEDGDPEDVFQILAKDGVNYCRLRLWNDPKNAEGKPYGGGDNDLVTDIQLARRAKAAGMKVLLDFHYSDHWADPSKQRLPKGWADALSFDISDYVGDFTKNSLQAFKDNGVTIDAVQIGNETNNSIASFPISAPDTIQDMVSAGVDAVKEVFPSAKTLVHLTNIKSPKGVYRFLDAVKDVPYDIVGLSYYPFWHGTRENLLNVMNTIASTYQKPSMVVETSYGFTDEITEYASNTYNSSTFETPGGYLTGFQGQATEVADIIDTLSQVSGGNGKGIFYWEPAWLPVNGAGWATREGQYYNDYGRDGTEAQLASYKDGLCSWANQGWFSYTGKALPSASTYKHIIAKDRAAVEVVEGLRTDTLDVNINLVKGINLPKTAQVTTNLDALRSRPIVWTQADIDAINAGGDGDYVVHGKVDGKFDITANVTAETNYVLDHSFEEQASGEEVPVGAPWTVENSIDRASRIEAKSEGNLDGEKYFHWYNSSDFHFTLSQTIHGVRAGNYDLSTYIMAGDLPSDYTRFDLWYQIGEGEKVSVDIISTVVKGWGSPLARFMNKAMIQNIEIAADNTDVTIGLTAEVKALGWGHCDLWSFSAHKEIVVDTNYIPDGDLSAQVSGSALGSPWTVDANADGAMSVGSEAMDTEAVNNVKWWDDAAFSFSFHQDIGKVEKGTYTLSLALLSDVASNYEIFDLYYQIGDADKVTVSLLPHCLGWNQTAEQSTQHIKIENIEFAADSTFTIGVECSAKAGAWGRMGDFSLKK